MKAAVIGENGSVLNIIEVEHLEVIPNLLNGEGADIGDQWDGTSFIKPTPPPASRFVPKEVTSRQGLQALAICNLLDLVQPLIDSIEDPLDRRLAQIEFDTSQVFKRDRPLIEQLRPGLGLTPEQLDDLFIFANSIP
jgi:hypothetical protein